MDKILFVQNQTKDKILKLKSNTKDLKNHIHDVVFAEMCGCFELLEALTKQHKNSSN